MIYYSEISLIKFCGKSFKIKSLSVGSLNKGPTKAFIILFQKEEESKVKTQY